MSMCITVDQFYSYPSCLPYYEKQSNIISMRFLVSITWGLLKSLQITIKKRLCKKTTKYI